MQEKTTISGNRLTIQTILGHLAAGDSVDDLIEMYPFLENYDIKACLEYAALREEISFEIPEAQKNLVQERIKKYHESPELLIEEERALEMINNI